jgi:hypothetical protein
MANKAHMLSTSDNPWSPWTHFNEWNTYDMQAGYHTLAYLARITVSSNELSQPDQDLAVELAIEEIVRLNINGLYVAVEEPESSSV